MSDSLTELEKVELELEKVELEISPIITIIMNNFHPGPFKRRGTHTYTHTHTHKNTFKYTTMMTMHDKIYVYRIAFAKVSLRFKSVVLLCFGKIISRPYFAKIR